ncbi:non-ribosomal peptide synthetase [Aspergillus sp. HF37]|nr:non-ribosomal peptide synthetase [Aspergillus sp. HF37]
MVDIAHVSIESNGQSSTLDTKHAFQGQKQRMGSIRTNGHADGAGFMCFNVAGLAADRSTPTGMREEVLLLSWLIVLMRTREDSQVSYEWDYKGRESGSAQTVQCLLADEMMAGLHSSVGQVAEEISRRVATVSPDQRAGTSGRVSLLLSTGSLSQAPETKDEGILHLAIRFDNAHLDICPTWHAESVPQYTVSHHVEALFDTIKMCLSSPDASIQDCLRPTARDLNDIWGWNDPLPPSYNFCMHDKFTEQAHKFPEKEAISSWDGSLTYAQVDQYSTSVACALKEAGVKLHDVMPLCFEKSRWAAVAVLAAMKAGATFVLMDPTLPLARLQNVARQVDAKTMLTSRKQHDLAASIIPGGKHIVVEADTFAQPSSLATTPKLPAVPPSALMYIIFTSGSTGAPKGVKISHETYTSSAIPRAEAVGYTESSRVLDFASYAFDVSIDSMLLTLGNGGCLCIPSDEDRLNDINGAIRRMRVDYAGLTPSVARILDPDVIKSLTGLGLGGEAVSARDAAVWGQDARITIGYGPCECTIGCTINSSAATAREYISIGKGNGAVIWIVNPSDHESLMPVGAVGELLVEGPIVGQGYLNDPDKTAAAFIEDPLWLISGHKGYSGRRGRLYKTGDLGKYDPDGSGGIVFAGRKDTQVKLRGQRVELGEIESQLRARLPSEAGVIAEVITPQGTGGQSTLVAFVAPQSAKGPEHTDLPLTQLPDELRRTLTEADADLSRVLPRYMVPTTYIPVKYIPVLISGKTDRKHLREFGATVDLRQLDQATTSAAARPLSELEHRLCQAWSQTLKLDPEAIRPTDNFFTLGGDSLAAMRLVSVCRTQGLELTVANTFGYPTLWEMADAVHVCDIRGRRETPAFSMISQSAEIARFEAARACGTSPEAVEDIYSCTPTQESLFTFSLKSVRAYVAQRLACIPPHVSIDAWKSAWEEVVAANPILRTRLAQLEDPGLQQVVLREGIDWKRSADLEQYLENDRNEKMDLGQSLARYAIVSHPDNEQRYMVWTVHHVLYDGWSEPLVLEKVGDALQGLHLEPLPQIKDFVKYVRDTDEVAMQEYWRRELEGAIGPQFPRLPSRDYLPTPDAVIEHQIPFDASAASPFTMATLIRGAWALVASQYIGSSDVVFGETLTGRDIPLPGVESIVGPLIATLPVRIHVHQASTVESYLRTLQQGMLARSPYQHTGMQNIRKVSRDAQHACEAPTGLVIQPDPEYTGSDLGFDQGDVVREALNFNPYPLMLACGLRKGGFRVCASFDNSLVEVAQMKRVLVQLEMACLQLSRDLSRNVGDISCLPEAELNQIWKWNQNPPLSLDGESKCLRADTIVKPGSIYPQAVVPWVCDPWRPSILSPIGCVGELWLEGTFLFGEAIESPAWLVAGSSVCAGRRGVVQPTGDMVRLQGDGRLIFVGRKEDVMPVQGYAVDIASLEAHISNHLPPEIRAAAAVSQPPSGSTQTVSERNLVVFIENQPSEDGSIELMPAEHNITCDSPHQKRFETTVCAVISIDLAVALKKLDKLIQDSLPFYMVPSAYIVVDKLPTDMAQIDRSLLGQLVSTIPRNVLAHLRERIKDAWAKYPAHTKLSVAEDILRSAWAATLRIAVEQIDVDDNFFRLGGDSVLAMRMVSALRSQSHGLTVADIFQHMRLCDAARVLRVDKVSNGTIQHYRPFSLLAGMDIERFLSETVRPKLANPRWSIRDVFPVTDSQALDIKGTIQAPRTSIQYTMLYFDSGIDQGRLFHACSDLVRAHEILRTVFIEHESAFFQVVLDNLDIPVNMYKSDRDLEQYVTELCTERIESNIDLGSSFLDMLHVEGRVGKQCLIIGLSHALYDGFSLPQLLRDLEMLYTRNRIADIAPFSTYMAQIRDGSTQDRALKYWRSLLKGSSLSVLPATSMHPTDRSIFHTKPTGISQPPEEVTTANLLTAAWAVVLARRLGKWDVTFGSVTSGRNIDIANVENVMGPCYQLTPVRVRFDSHWTVMDLLRFVQRQGAESAEHDFLGFDKVSSHCTQWSPKAAFFDSIVHHQDVEDFDSMPFAGESCRVEVLKPHGDAAYPLKVVSFVQGGQMHVGVVGSEREPMFVDAVLDELAATVQDMATSTTRHL